MLKIASFFFARRIPGLLFKEWVYSYFYLLPGAQVLLPVTSPPLPSIGKAYKKSEIIYSNPWQIILINMNIRKHFGNFKIIGNNLQFTLKKGVNPTP